LRGEAPVHLAIEELRIGNRDDGKRNLNLSRSIGNAWLKNAMTALARVPSAILPNTFNYLYNPLHRDAKHVRIVSSSKANLDPRLLRHLRSG